MICPYCKKESKRAHYTTCGENLSHLRVEFDTFVFNDTSGVDFSSKDEFEHMYVVDQFSLPDFKKKFGWGYHHTQMLLYYFEIPVRDIKAANNTIRSTSKREQVFLEKYGATNPLSKGTTAYEKRNKTIQERYGVGNIFQVQAIISKIHDTKEENGTLGKSDVEKHKQTKLSWSAEKRNSVSNKLRDARLNLTDEQKYDIGRKRIATLSKNGAYDKKQKTSLESKISEVLVALGIPHTFSFYVEGRQFDFHLLNTNILIECNGDYWHANPLLYLPDAMLSHPGRKIKAESLWAIDYHKYKIAHKHNYDVIYIWEAEIKKCEMIEIIESRLRQFLEVHQP